MGKRTTRNAKNMKKHILGRGYNRPGGNNLQIYPVGGKNELNTDTSTFKTHHLQRKRKEEAGWHYGYSK